MLVASQEGLANIQVKHYLPTGIQLGMDVTRPLYYQYEKLGGQYEFNGLIDFNRLLLQGDYGWGQIARWGVSKQNIRSVANHQGQYFRIGADYNFISHSIDDNAAFLGFRYAKSYFKEKLRTKLLNEANQLGPKQGKQQSPWGDYPINITQEDMEARWFEVVAGVRVKAWKWIYLGCTARYKFGKKLTPEGYTPFDIIGWGLNDEDALGLNLYLIIRLPLQSRALNEVENKPQSPSSKQAP